MSAAALIETDSPSLSCPKRLWKTWRHTKAVTFLAGDEVIGEGERGNALYIVTQVGQRRPREVGTPSCDPRRDFFGEAAMLGDDVRTATVRHSPRPCCD